MKNNTSKISFLLVLLILCFLTISCGEKPDFGTFTDRQYAEHLKKMWREGFMSPVNIGILALTSDEGHDKSESKRYKIVKASAIPSIDKFETISDKYGMNKTAFTLIIERSSEIYDIGESDGIKAGKAKTEKEIKEDKEKGMISYNNMIRSINRDLKTYFN